MNKKYKLVLFVLLAVLLLSACSAENSDLAEISYPQINYAVSEKKIFDNEFLIDNICTANGDFYGIVTAIDADSMYYQAVKIDSDGEYSILDYKKDVNEGIHPIIAADSEGNVSIFEAQGSDMKAFSLQSADGVKLQNIDKDYVIDFLTDTQGNYYLTTDNTVYKFNSAGELAEKIGFNGSYTDALISEDKLFLLTGEEGNTYINEVSFDENKTNKLLGIPLLCNKLSDGQNAGFDLVVGGGDGMFGINLEEEPQVQCLIMFHEYGCSGEKIMFGTDSFGNINLIRLKPGEGDGTFTVLSKFSVSENGEDRKKLELGCFVKSDQLMNAVDTYNRSDGKSYISVKEYAPEEFDKLKTDIISGNGPDILELTGMSYMEYCNAGVFENLYPYIDAENDLHRDELKENVLKSLDYNGALYSVVPSFQIKAVVGNLDFAKASWDFQKLMEYESTSQPSFANVTNLDVLHLLCANDVNYIFDFNDFSFNSENYKDLLEYCAAYPSKLSNDSYREMGDTGAEFVSVSNFYEIQVYEKFFGSDAEFMNFQSDHACISPSMQFAILKNSELKSESWDFISHLLSYDYQKENMGKYGFPVRNDVLKLMADNALSPEEEHIGGFENVEYTPATPEQIEKTLDLLDRDLTLMYSGPALEILQNEAAAYFAGDSDITSTVEQTKSKVDIYFAEKR